jgi:hypothetical protein
MRGILDSDTIQYVQRQYMHSSIDELVNEILRVNHAWKTACDLFKRDASLSISLRGMKNRLQVQLLRLHHPKVFLEVDPAETGIVYSLRLQSLYSRHHNAAHLPDQVARSMLSSTELTRFLKQHSNPEDSHPNQFSKSQH